MSEQRDIMGDFVPPEVKPNAMNPQSRQYRIAEAAYNAKVKKFNKISGGEAELLEVSFGNLTTNGQCIQIAGAEAAIAMDKLIDQEERENAARIEGERRNVKI